MRLQIELPEQYVEKLKAFADLIDINDVNVLGAELLMASLIAWDTYSQIGFLRKQHQTYDVFQALI